MQPQASTSGQPAAPPAVVDPKVARQKLPIVRITDEHSRQSTFNKRKNGLMKKAMELSVLCDCDISLIVFNADGKLYQYSSKDMETILERYSKACHEPHERRNNQQLWRLHYTGRPGSYIPGGSDIPNGTNKRLRTGEPASGRRPGNAPASPAQSDGSVSSLSEGSLLGPSGDVLKPLGLTIDKHQFSVSPRSEAAYERINTEFDKLMEQLYVLHEAPKDGLAVQAGAVGTTEAAAATANGLPVAKRYKELSVAVPDMSRKPHPAAASGAKVEGSHPLSKPSPSLPSAAHSTDSQEPPKRVSFPGATPSTSTDQDTSRTDPHCKDTDGNPAFSDLLVEGRRMGQQTTTPQSSTPVTLQPGPSTSMPLSTQQQATAALAAAGPRPTLPSALTSALRHPSSSSPATSGAAQFLLNSLTGANLSGNPSAAAAAAAAAAALGQLQAQGGAAAAAALAAATAGSSGAMIGGSMMKAAAAAAAVVAAAARGPGGVGNLAASFPGVSSAAIQQHLQQLQQLQLPQAARMLPAVAQPATAPSTSQPAPAPKPATATSDPHPAPAPVPPSTAPPAAPASAPAPPNPNAAKPSPAPGAPSEKPSASVPSKLPVATPAPAPQESSAAAAAPPAPAHAGIASDGTAQPAAAVGSTSDAL